MSSNIFSTTAVQICKMLRKAGIQNYIAHFNKFNNSVYIRFTEKTDKYHSIRISNHPTKSNPRYSLRTDIKQSRKFKEDGIEYFIYSIKDIKGLRARIIKEIPVIV